MFDPDRFISERLCAIDASGIRRVFDLAARIKDPINLSIGQPHFDVPEAIKRAAVEAIEQGHNQYTVTQGLAPLQANVRRKIEAEFPLWAKASDYGSLIVSGVSGGLMLALLTCVQPGDEVIMPDPYFVLNRHLVTLAGAEPVYVDCYPDFQFTAERIERHINSRTKIVMFNSPSNPTGVVADHDTCRQVVDLCNKHGLLLLSDEIYDEFCYEKAPAPGGVPGGHDANGPMRCPSPAAYSTDLLLMRGYSKTYGMTGWRLGFVAGPKPILEQMTKLQQYSFVCAPSMVQVAAVDAFDVDVSDHTADYQRKRDRVVERLSGAYELTPPGGAFYVFPKVPDRLGLTGTQFVERAVERKLLLIPGSVFSNRDTHFRLSYACDDAQLDKGLDILLELA